MWTDGTMAMAKHRRMNNSTDFGGQGQINQFNFDASKVTVPDNNASNTFGHTQVMSDDQESIKLPEISNKNIAIKNSNKHHQSVQFVDTIIEEENYI